MAEVKTERGPYGHEYFRVWRAEAMLNGEIVRVSSFYTEKETAANVGVSWIEGYAYENFRWNGKFSGHGTGKLDIGCDDERNGEFVTVFINSEMVFAR